MDFNLIIKTKEQTILNLNHNEFTVKEIQKNRLSSDTIENKIFLLFKDMTSYKNNGDTIISADIDEIKLTTHSGEIVFERTGLEQKNISLFSNVTENEINMNIIVFDYLS